MCRTKPPTSLKKQNTFYLAFLYKPFITRTYYFNKYSIRIFKFEKGITTQIQ